MTQVHVVEGCIYLRRRIHLRFTRPSLSLVVSAHATILYGAIRLRDDQHIQTGKL